MTNVINIFEGNPMKNSMFRPRQAAYQFADYRQSTAQLGLLNQSASQFLYPKLSVTKMLYRRRTMGNHGPMNYQERLQ
jgi:hypothetical protein